MKFWAQPSASSSTKAESFAPYLRPYLDEFEEITHVLAYDTRFTLVPVEVPTMDVGHGFLRYLELSGRKIRRIEPAPGQWRDLARLLKSLPKVEREIVIILGPRERPPDLSEGLNILNFSRDSIDRHLGRPLVLCGLRFFLNAVVQNAPDLWSFREITHVVKPKITPYDPENSARPLLWFEPTDEPRDVRVQLERARADHDEAMTGRLSLRLARAFLTRYRIADAERALSEARAIIEGNAAFQGRREAASCYETMGDVAYGKGDLKAAQDAYSEALEVYEEMSDVHDATRIMGKLGLVHHMHPHEKWKRLAAAFYEKANVESERLGDQSIRAPLLYYLGTFYTQRGDATRATQYLDEALDAFRKMNDRIGEAYVLVAHAELHFHDDDVTQALGDARAAEAIFAENQHDAGRAHALEMQGFIYRDKLAEYASALDRFRAARTIHERQGSRFRAGLNAISLADVHIELDRAGIVADLQSSTSLRWFSRLLQRRSWLDAAVEELNRAITIFEEIGDMHRQSIAYRRRGNAAHYQYHLVAAICDYQNAVETGHKSGVDVVEADARKCLAQVYTEVGDLDGAVQQLTQALELIPPNEVITRVATLLALSVTKRVRGNLDEALADLAEARRLLGGKPIAQFEAAQAKIAAEMARVHLLAGRIDEARAHAEDAARWAREGNAPDALAVSTVVEGLIEQFEPKTAARLMWAMQSLGARLRAVWFWDVRRQSRMNRGAPT